MNAAATHRKDDDNGDHTGERDWTGPTRHEWDELMAEVRKINQVQTDVCDIQKALWGSRREGINDDGGVIGEVRRLRDIRRVAWSGLLSATNRSAAAARQDAYNERSALREIRTNTAAAIDNVTFNLTNDLQTTTSLTNGYSAAEARSLINTLRRELIDQSQELKTALQQIQALRKYEANQ